MNSTKPSKRWGTPEERFTQRTKRQGTCLVWTGSVNSMGYGQMTVDRVKVCVHRYSYERSVGPIPEGMLIDHRCHNKACVEPKHLRPVTPKQNIEHLRGAYSSSKTGVRGVHLDSRRGTYTAEVVHNYVKHNLGSYRTIAEAEAVVIAKRNELFTHNDYDRKAVA